MMMAAQILGPDVACCNAEYVCVPVSEYIQVPYLEIIEILTIL
jgi:hypothetical protein